MDPARRNESDAAGARQNPAQNSPGVRDYDALLEFLPVAIFTLQPDGRIRSLNSAATTLLGHDVDSVAGRTCDEVLRCAYCAEACAACEARSEGAPRRDFPVEVQRADGERRSVLMDAVPLEGGEVAVMLRDVTEAVRAARSPAERMEFRGIVYSGEPMRGVIERVREVAPFDSTVLIIGESGTGKELLARAIHAESARAQGPFVVVNCSAHGEALLESELFGHAKGSRPDAERERKGRFELAGGGTVLLDEVGELHPRLQVKLLRLLQKREIERVGESRPRSVDLRVVAATDRDLAAEVDAQRFRADLFYRLNVVRLALPPLRERMEDLPALVDVLLERLAVRLGKRIREVRPEVRATLMEHSWPGNVRELENALECALLHAHDGILAEVDLPLVLRQPRAPEEEMREALRRTAGCVTRAARLMGVHRTTLWRHMKELGLTREEFQEGSAESAP